MQYISVYFLAGRVGWFIQQNSHCIAWTYYCPTTLCKPVALFSVISCANGGQSILPICDTFPLCGCIILLILKCHQIISILIIFYYFFKNQWHPAHSLHVHLNLLVDADGSQDAHSLPPGNPDCASSLPEGFLLCQGFSQLPTLVASQSWCRLNQPEQGRMGIGTKPRSPVSARIILRCTAPCSADQELIETSSLTFSWLSPLMWPPPPHLFLCPGISSPQTYMHPHFCLKLRQRDAP